VVYTNITPAAAGTVYLCAIDVPWDCIVDRLQAHIAAVNSGHVRLGLYREGSTQDSPAGGALVVESASTAPPGASRPIVASVSDTLLTRGLHFLAVQADNTTVTIQIIYAASAIWSYSYTRAGGYGAFTNPCPSASAENNQVVGAIRVKQVVDGGMS